MRLHVLGFPWSETTAEFSWCGHTSMCSHFATMMHRQGHEVFLYAGEANDVECTKHIPVVTRAEQARWFGDYDRNMELGTFPGIWDPASEWWVTMNARIVGELAAAEPGDLLCILAGQPQQPVATILPGLKTVEYAVGYRGAFAPYRCYASNAWRHFIHGTERDDHGRFFDTVIPHFFDPDDFHLAPKDDYLLYLGRLNHHKGIGVANDVAKKTGRQLLVAGQGDPSLCPDAEYFGVVTSTERADLLARAHAVLMPSLYFEPFGAVAVEAMMSGTPVISTNWGAFPEIIQDGCGTRCDMFADFVSAVDAKYQKPWIIRKTAIERFSMDVIGPQYDRWFDRLATLDGDGWYSEPDMERVV